MSSTITSPEAVYTIDWSNVIAIEPASLLDAVNTDIGPCVCDLTWYACDPNCFCDADCSDSEIQQFSFALPEGPVSTDVLKCWDKDSVAMLPLADSMADQRSYLASKGLFMNLRGRLTYTVFDNLLCVAVENNPSKGSFYSSPTSLDYNQIEWLQNDADAIFSFEDMTQTTESLIMNLGDANYTVGVPLTAAAQGSDNRFYFVYGGRLPSRAADLSGYCSTVNPARYLQIASNWCTPSVTNAAGRRRPVALADVCVSSYSANNAALHLSEYLGFSVGGAPNAALDALHYFPITLEGLVYTDPITVTQFEFQLYQDLMDTSYNSFAQTPSVTILSPTGTYLPSFNSTTCTCSNVVLQVSYMVQHTLDGYVSGVDAYVALGDISGEGDSCVMPETQQNFVMRFNSTNSGDWSGRPKSGNPGYIVNAPVLAGTKVVENNRDPRTAINQFVDGLTVTGPDADGLCSSNLGNQVQVLFGVDMLVGCSSLMNLAEFGAWCAPHDASMLNISAQVVGMWGSSSLLSQWDWIDIEIRENPMLYDVNRTWIASSWDASRRVCTNGLVGMKVS